MEIPAKRPKTKRRAYILPPRRAAVIVAAGKEENATRESEPQKTQKTSELFAVLLSRIADAAEKLSVAGWAVGVFEHNMAAICIGFICFAFCLLCTWRTKT
jgi:hypothetical protein